MGNTEILTLSASLEFNRILEGYNKTELTNLLGISQGTFRRKSKNPLSFTLDELIQLKKILKKATIDEIFQLNKKGA